MKKYPFCLILVAFVLTTTSILAQEPYEKLYRIYITDPSEIKLLAEQDYDIYAVKPGNYIEVSANTDKIKAL